MLGGENESLPGLITLKSNAISELYGMASTQADYEYIEQISSLIDKSIDIINNAGDVNRDVADNLESSDAIEMDYLDDLTAETSASIQDISPLNEFTYQERNATRNILDIIWSNRFVKDLLVICGCFMVVCVVLGIRYKI